jgi:tetratricopeptide (TPR) repeat protein
MRRLALALCCLSCAEWRMAPTFPQQAAERPVVHEQALLGLSEQGDAAVAELVDAEGEAPALTLSVWGREGEPARTLLVAPPDRAGAVAARIRDQGRLPAPLLAAAIQREWPEAFEAAARQGYPARPPVDPGAGEEAWRITGARDAGALPLTLRVGRTGQPALVLLLSDGGTGEIEISRMPLAGTPAPVQLWLQGGTAWLLCGSVLPQDPLRRAIGLRRASALRGEARLHNQHGLEDYGAGDLEAARREFGRAIAADPGFVDGLYNGAAAAALAHRADEAVALLRRAAAIDPARVQVLGRNDEDLESLRGREDVRALLGLRRLPPKGVPPPP